MTRFSLKAIILLLVLVVPLGSVMAQAVKKRRPSKPIFYSCRPRKA